MIQPAHLPWFRLPSRYAGRATAILADEFGELRGRAVVRVGGAGAITIELTVDQATIAAGARLPFLYDLIWPSRPNVNHQKAQATVRPVEIGGLRIDRLTMEGRRGQFVAEDLDASLLGSISLSDPPPSITLTCDASVSRFRALRGRDPEYWVAPLLNFVTTCREPSQSLGNHPLRPVATQPDQNQPLEPALRRLGIAGGSPTDLIRFDANGPAFISPFSDPERARAILRQSRDRTSITAVMVGSVGGRGVDDAALQTWFPFDLLEWLSVVSGAGVNIPWLEFRDCEGLLVSRVHFDRHAPRFNGGRPIIDEAIHGGLGRALSLAARSEHFRATPLRVALRAIQAVRPPEVNRDDTMLRLLLALEGLSTMLGAHRVLASTWASPETDAQAQAIVGDAVTSLDNLSASLRDEARTDEAEMISRVQKAVRRQYPPQLGAGKAIVAMLTKLGLQDVNAVDSFLRDHPLLGEKSLARLLDQCRGRLAHHGYLAETGEGLSPRQAFALLMYFQDLTVRVVFSIIGYDGPYDPPVICHRASEPVGWICPTTPASLLGFV